MSTKTGVIGHPIAHSKSPLIHRYWIEKHGLDATFDAIDIAPHDLRAEIMRLIDENYRGVNVTIPHKSAVMDVCDHVDEKVQAIGAVNTLMFENNKVLGTNTDAFGFMENLKQTIGGYTSAGKTALVIGAGGAAKAVIYALLDNGIEHVIICNRTLQKAEDLADAFDRTQTMAWDEINAALAKADIIINTTSLGMKGYPPLTLDFTQVKREAIAYDIVYTPLMTPFLTDANAAGLDIVTGIGMLIHQARPAFKHWHGVMPDADEALIAKVLNG